MSKSKHLSAKLGLPNRPYMPLIYKIEKPYIIVAFRYQNFIINQMVMAKYEICQNWEDKKFCRKHNDRFLCTIGFETYEKL